MVPTKSRNLQGGRKMPRKLMIKEKFDYQLSTAEDQRTVRLQYLTVAVDVHTLQFINMKKNFFKKIH